MPTSNTRDPSPNCGHVFLLHCSSENMAADAILVPGNPGPKEGVQLIDDFEDDLVHMFQAASLKGVKDPSQYLSFGKNIVQDFLDKATSAVSSNDSKFKRSKPLLALPIPGIGTMDPDGIIQDEGSAIEAILPMVYDHVDKYPVDIAICTTETDAYSVLQVYREKLCPFTHGPFWMLSTNLRDRGDQLAREAIDGALSIFVGAGVSYPSGLPSWGGLLQSLAKKAGFSEEEQKSLAKLDYLDQPTLIEERMGSSFRQAIADCVKGGRYTPAHAILSELRVPAATTNYDDCFESTADSYGETLLRLPWNSDIVSAMGSKASRSITKLHGCVSDPKQIVLTRQDYMRYEDDRRALRGIVHHFLLTTNILFVGFSMTDDNLHRIIDEAREALAGDDKCSSKLGTISCLVENEMFRNLWKNNFDVISFGKSWGDNPAWLHDCFYDYVGSQVAKHRARCSFILNPKFTTLLSESERTICDAFNKIIKISKDSKVRDAEAWTSVQELLNKFGLPRHLQD